MNLEVFTGGAFQTNGYLLQNGERAVLFDAPENVAAWLRDKDIRIEALVLTHLHHDHVIDAARLVETQQCLVYSHSEPTRDITLEALMQQYFGEAAALDPFAPDELLAGRDRIELAGISFGILHVPGHSPDSLCFGPVESPDLGAPILIGGDVLFRGSIGRTDFPHGDHQLLLTGIREKLFALPEDVHVLPGHGPTTTIGFEKENNPFL